MSPRKSRRFILVALAAAAVFFAAAARAQDVRIVVDGTARGPAVNSQLYGIFLEEINHGVDGGLYAELLRNRGFEDAKPPEGFALRQGRWTDAFGHDSGFSHPLDGLPYWHPVATEASTATLALDLEAPLDPAGPRSLRLEARVEAGGRAGFSNSGFWGIGVRAGAAFELSFFARSEKGRKATVKARLETADGRAVSDEAAFEVAASDWRRSTAKITAHADEPKARLVLWTEATGRLWFDMVSLFPSATWKGRKNGLRTDIAAMIAALEPAFVRFPGGCVVEGGTIETAYDWKKTIGPLESREEIWNAWGYRRTHGMGLYEYLTFCEDLRAEPLYVGFAGQSCAYRSWEHVPMPQMARIAQDFVDVLEYANGPADSTWGAWRAAAGHPSPFALRWIEIGNENMGSGYEERYPALYAAIKKARPDALTMACFLQTRAPTEVVDEHFYNSPRWFFENTELYDRRDRSLPPVYVGEVAVTSEEGGPLKGNMLAALAEGAFLMGLERNADVVRLVSYAPLLAHVDGRSDWHAMIYHDATRVFGTASYHLWKLFATNRPDYTLRTSLRPLAVETQKVVGAVGVGTWETAAEFKDLTVEKGGVVLHDSNRDVANWGVDGGRWETVGGVRRQIEAAVGYSWFGDEGWTDYRVRVKARKTAGEEGFLLVFGKRGAEKLWWNVGGWRNSRHAVEWNRSPVGSSVRGSIETDRWYDLEVEIAGDRIVCRLDGVVVHDLRLTQPRRVFALGGRDGRTGELVLKLINATAAPVDAEIDLSSVLSSERNGHGSILAAASADANNAIDAPARIAPQPVSEVVRPRGRRILPPWSFTVLRAPLD